MIDVKGVIMITLKDLAAAVGVSASAVSLVLNGRDTGRVNPQTAQRIREAAHDMGYIPNVLARGLKTRRTHTIGIISDGVASVPFAGRMLEGVQSAAWDAGYLAMIIDTTGRPELVEQSSKSLMQRDIEALVMAAEYHRMIEVPAIPPTIPVIVLDGVPDDPARADSVVPDEFGGAYAATSHIVGAGHRRIAFCTVAGKHYIAGQLRLDGYRQALNDGGITPDPALVIELPDFSTATVFPLVKKLLDDPGRPTAVFCFSDRIAFACYQACADLGLRVPDDLSIVGFDDQRFIADALRPGLTTVRLPHFEMGSWAAAQAFSRIQGEAGADHVAHKVTCPLVIRESVAPL